jgi:RNA polymerase sigma-70 factor, ECF subfamily
MASGAQSVPSVPDEEIVRRFQETGDNDSFAELFARYRKRVFSACRAFFAEGGLAEDATQEAFIRTYQNIHRFQGGDFSAWVMKIAKNVCIDVWRKRRWEVGYEDAEATKRPALVAADSSSDLRLAAERAWQEMRSLSPDQRRCLEMKIQGYSYEETAALTGLSIEAVKSHLQNGRRMLWLKIKGIGQQK